MAVTEGQVKRAAKLSKLPFSEGGLVDFTNQLDKIINMVELLEEIDTTGVPFTSNINESINVTHEDVAIPGVGRKELMQDVPKSENGHIKVSVIMDNGGTGA